MTDHDYVDYRSSDAPCAVDSPLSRRAVALRVVLAGVLVRAHAVAWAGTARVPTPETGRGPFYPVDDGTTRDWDLLRPAAGPVAGQPLEIVGRVIDLEGEPVSGARLVAWQADAHGVYDHPEAAALLGETMLDPGFAYWGRAATDAEGEYRFRTIEPGHYTVDGRYRPRHVHMEITAPGHRTLPTEMHFDGDPWAAGDSVTTLAQHELLKVVPEPAADLGTGWLRARFDIVMRRS